MRLRCSQSVAAAAQNDQRNNDDPAAVVVATKNVTETVIHSKILLEILEPKARGDCRFISLGIILC